MQHTTLETLWDAARAGLIDWPSVQQHQNRMMPRCINHPDRAAPVVWNDQAMCADCVAALVAVRREER